MCIQKETNLFFYKSQLTDFMVFINLFDLNGNNSAVDVILCKVKKGKSPIRGLLRRLELTELIQCSLEMKTGEHTSAVNSENQVRGQRSIHDFFCKR